MTIEGITTIISEIDGVITDNKVDIGELNIPLSKKFNLRDFEAINLLKKRFNFIFMSAYGNINLTLCRKRNIPFFVVEKSKKETIGLILNKYGLSPDKIIYVGSNYSDVDCIRMAGKSFCPSNAALPVLKSSDVVLMTNSGDGVLCELYEYIEAYITMIERGTEL